LRPQRGASVGLAGRATARPRLRWVRLKNGTPHGWTGAPLTGPVSSPRRAMPSRRRSRPNRTHRPQSGPLPHCLHHQVTHRILREKSTAPRCSAAKSTGWARAIALPSKIRS
jgi:hypothetical protein